MTQDDERRSGVGNGGGDMTGELLKVLNPELARQLLLGLLEVAKGSGFGAVELVMADGKVTMIKTVKSYRVSQP